MQQASPGVGISFAPSVTLKEHDKRVAGALRCKMSEVRGVNNADVVVAFSPLDELVAKIDYTIERALLAQAF